MEKVKHILRSYALDLIMGVGAAAVTIGAGMIYLPAGWIAVSYTHLTLPTT